MKLTEKLRNIINRRKNNKMKLKLSLKTIAKKRFELTNLLNYEVDDEIDLLSEFTKTAGMKSVTESSLLRAEMFIKKLCAIENILNNDFDVNSDQIIVSSNERPNMLRVRCLSKETPNLLNMGFVAERIDTIDTTTNELNKSVTLNNALIEDQSIV